MLSRRTLLLADDSPTVQKVVSLTFADEGMQVLTASGGEEALARLGEAVPDVLLADVHMPAPGGYELCARVRRDPRTSRVPVLLLVGTFEPFDEAEARRVGADGVLTKPFQSIRELVNKVGGLIGGHSEQNKPARAGHEDAAAAREEAPAAAPAAPDSFPHTAAEDLQPSHAFAGLDADDESIQSLPADDYVAAARSRSADASAEFVTADAPPAREATGEPLARSASGGVGEVRVAEAAAGVAEASPLGAAAGGRAPGGYPASRFGAPPPTPGFPPRPPQPPSEDSLLELDELIPPQSSAADFDDLILDIGDDADAPGARAEASESAEAFGIVDLEVEASAGRGAGAEISPANLSSAWSDAPRIEVPPARAPFAEPLIDEADAPAFVEPEFEVEAETTADAESPVAPVAAEAVAAEDATPAAGAATLTEVARPEVADSRTDAAEAARGAAQLSPEMVEAVARRVVELMSDAAVREIAWEVVPDLAERLIRERLAQENARTS